MYMENMEFVLKAWKCLKVLEYNHCKGVGTLNESVIKSVFSAPLITAVSP